MLFQQMNHHLIFMLNRHIEEKFKETGYKCIIAPGEITINNVKTSPAFAVYGPGSDSVPVFVADVDTQSCGPQKNFADKIQAYSDAGVNEYWIFYTKDHLIIVRRQEENGFGRHKVYSESDLLVPDGLFPAWEQN